MQIEKSDNTTSAGRLIQRFVHLLSALGIEGLLSTLFFIYLAWLDASAYGELMVAMAAGSVVLVGIRFGLYYPLVAELGKADDDEASRILSRVNIIKLALVIPSLLSVYGLAWFRGFSTQMALVLFFITLGFALEAIAETFFAYFRVKGLQDIESRLKIISSVSGYGYGFLAAFLGFDPVWISLFLLVSGLSRLCLSVAMFMKSHSGRIFLSPRWETVWTLFRTAIIFAMIDNLGNLYNKTNIFFLEKSAGVEGVAFYSATWNVVDAIAKLASEQFLGWVIFPVLSTLWWKNRDAVGDFVRANARWLLAIAFPIMFILYCESGLIIGTIYPDEYKDAIWMQKYLIWTIPFTFEGNLFAYIMIVAGAGKRLLFFSVITMVLNIFYNILLVDTFNLAGGCLVIIFSKLTMTLLTMIYCQIRFSLFRLRDGIFPLLMAGIALTVFLFLRPVVTLHPAVFLVLSGYGFVLWKWGTRFLGHLKG